MAHIPRPIDATDSLKTYLGETLKLEDLKRVRKTESSRSGEKEKLRIRNNDEAKVRNMDNLFESMANLIYFFEFINKHPEMIEKYCDDIEDLFGLKSNSTNPKGSPIARLVKSILGRGYGPSGYDDSADSRFYFRRRVLCILQFSINEKLKFYALHSPKVSQDARFFNMIYTDLERTDVWANYLDKYMTDGKKNPKRVLNINA